MTRERHSTSFGLANLEPRAVVHLAGIAGSAMSGLAVILRQRGLEVVGTDPKAASVHGRLDRLGVRLFTEQDGSRISPDTRLVVRTAAMPADHPELAAAARRGLTVVTYAELLGALMAERIGIAVAGTHGKTTTTAMIVSCLRHAGVSPGFVVGGFVPELGCTADNGQPPYFVAEACEYNRSFLSLCPRISVITNIDADHLDFYRDIEEIQEAFAEFAALLPAADGVLVHASHCPRAATVAAGTACRRRSFGLEESADVRALRMALSPAGSTFDLHIDGGKVASMHLRVPGKHNVLDALAAMAVVHELGLPLGSAMDALASFCGVSRRFDCRGEAGGITIVDDYAHHPTELGTLLDAARVRYPGRRLVILFQPHQASRTRLLLGELAEALARADLVLVPDIYPARDSAEELARTRAPMLVERVAAAGMTARYLGPLEGAAAAVLEILEPGDVLITAGAGDVDTIIPEILRGLSQPI